VTATEERYRADVVIVGGGFVGLPLAAFLAGDHPSKFRVTVIDHLDEATMLQRVREAGLREAWDAGRPRCVNAADDDAVSQAMKSADLTVICVPTPSRRDGGGCDTSIVEQVASRWARSEPIGLLAIKSTVLPGTTMRIARSLGDLARRVLFWPEFMAEGTAIADLRNPSRTIIGATGGAFDIHNVALNRLIEIAPREDVVVTTATTAEGVKYAANVMLAARLTVANELALLVAASGGDGREAVRLAGLDPRIGSQYLNPQAGWGGSCFPKDVEAVRAMGSSVAAAILHANTRHARWTRGAVGTAMMRLLEERGQARVCVLGRTFKAGTNDERTAVHMMAVREAFTRLATPDDIHSGRVRLEVVDSHDDWKRTVAGADIVVLGTDCPVWTSYGSWLGVPLDGKVVIDTRGRLPRALMVSRAHEGGRGPLAWISFGRPIPDGWGWADSKIRPIEVADVPLSEPG
jgi:UDPglucose 6-dehydrogenase